VKATDWYTLFKISFGIGGILFFSSVVAALYDRSGGFYRDFGIFGLLVSTFVFVIAYVCYRRFKVLSLVKK
jgi:hypothetical protein